MKLFILLFICFIFITNDLVESACRQFSRTLCAPCKRYRIYKSCSVCIRKLNKRKCCFNPTVLLRLNTRSMCQPQNYSINRCSICKRNKNQSLCFKCIRRLNRSNKCYNTLNRYALLAVMQFCEPQRYNAYKCSPCKHRITQNACIDCVKQFNGLFNCYNMSNTNSLRQIRVFCRPRYYIHRCSICKLSNNQNICIKCVKKLSGPYNRCYNKSDPNAPRTLRLFCKARVYNIDRCRYCKNRKTHTKCIDCVRNINRHYFCYNPRSRDDLLILRVFCNPHGFQMDRCNKCKRYTNPSSCYNCVRRLNRLYSCYNNYNNNILLVQAFCSPGKYNINRCRQCKYRNNQNWCFKCVKRLNKSYNCYNNRNLNSVRKVHIFCKPRYVSLSRCITCKRYNKLNPCIKCVRQMNRAYYGCYKSHDPRLVRSLRIFCKPRIYSINMCNTCKGYNNLNECVKCVKRWNYSRKCYNSYNRNDLQRVRIFCKPKNVTTTTNIKDGHKFHLRIVLKTN